MNSKTDWDKIDGKNGRISSYNEGINNKLFGAEFFLYIAYSIWIIGLLIALYSLFKGSTFIAAATTFFYMFLAGALFAFFNDVLVRLKNIQFGKK